MTPTFPPADSPTVELRVGDIYQSHHWRQTNYLVLRTVPGYTNRFIVRNLDEGYEREFEGNGRVWGNMLSWGDLIYVVPNETRN